MGDYQSNTSEKLVAAQEIEQYFQNLGKKSVSNNTKKPFANKTFVSTSKILNLTKMDKLGTAIIHIIPDSYHNYIRVLQYFYEIYVKEPQYDKDTGAPKLDKDGKQIVWNRTKYVLDPMNYDAAGLSPDQVMLCTEVHNLAKEYADLAKSSKRVEDEVMGIKYRKEISLFYGYLNALIVGGKIAESGGMKVFRHNSANFSKNFVDATSTKTSTKGSVMWMSEWFSRMIGRNTKITSIQTSLSTGYTTNFAFDDTDRGVELTQADMDFANNIFAEFVDVTKFDSNEYMQLKALLIDKINKAKAIIADMSNSVQQSAPVGATVIPVSNVAPNFNNQMSNVNLGQSQQTPLQGGGLGQLPL